MSRHFAVAALFASTLFASPVMAETLTFHAKMNGASEVPANASSGSGEATVTLDTATNMLTYNVTFSGLTGAATMGHIHGPAAPGANAGVVVPFAGPVVSPLHGQATITASQAADLMAGKYYANIHTDANKGGEIRGQLIK